jgi:hypothetical protein
MSLTSLSWRPEEPFSPTSNDREGVGSRGVEGANWHHLRHRREVISALLQIHSRRRSVQLSIVTGHSGLAANDLASAEPLEASEIEFIDERSKPGKK